MKEKRTVDLLVDIDDKVDDTCEYILDKLVLIICSNLCYVMDDNMVDEVYRVVS